MSETEKEAQAGAAMFLLVQQKKDLSHLATKIERVRLAYRTFAGNRDRWRHDPSDRSRVILIHPAAEERELGAYLLPQDALAALLTEFDAATNAVQASRAKLQSFGILDV